MNWTYFDERTPDDGQLIIAANLKGARQFWLWNRIYGDMATMKVLEMEFWCPVPDLPKPPDPPDPFENYWTRETAHYSAYPNREAEARAHFNAGREYERKMK